ncbi:MAG: alpha/beta hydrolase [Bradyrhizobiaceae bacterium]|nr:alpha/beta hydrolase [Bradyrhizobiaceae bacterium]
MNGELRIDGRKIETAWFGPAPEQAPTLVLLHEGLGCVAMWRDFPQRLAERTRCGVLAYSRFGYGQSDPAPLPWPLTYMHDETLQILPRVLDAAGIRKTILVGHSDGASIATIYAGGTQDFRVRGIALLAPHFLVEDISIQSIAAAKTAYDTGGLRERLARYHRNVDVAFRGWNDAWLDPEFRKWRLDEYVAHIRAPMLIVQGADDQYGTLEQIRLAEREAYCPVETAILDRCGHSPHLDQPKATLEAVAAFAHRILAVHEGLMPAA